MPATRGRNAGDVPPTSSGTTTPSDAKASAASVDVELPVETETDFGSVEPKPSARPTRRRAARVASAAGDRMRSFDELPESTTTPPDAITSASPTAGSALP